MDGSPQKCKHARCSATLKRGGKNNGYCRAHAESATTSDCFTEADRALLNTLAADLKFHSSGLNKEMKSITAVIKPFLTYMQKSATKMSQLQKENNELRRQINMFYYRHDALEQYGRKMSINVNNLNDVVKKNKEAGLSCEPIELMKQITEEMKVDIEMVLLCLST